MRIGFIGTGIAGLALGAALHRAGMDVQVYEEHAQIRSGGAGITLAPNGLAALDALGIGADFRALQQQQMRPLGATADGNGNGDRALSRSSAQAHSPPPCAPRPARAWRFPN